MKKVIVLLSLALFVISGNINAQRKYISINFSSGDISTSGVSDYSTNSCSIEDRYDDDYHLKLLRGSWFEFKFYISSNPSSAELQLKHLSSYAGNQAGITPISVFINDKKLISWNQLEPHYTTNKIKVGNYLKSGNNTIRIQYSSSGGTTGYWLKYIHVYVW